jgi:hypothetical protein
VIEAQLREWCEQILVEVVLAARNSSWSPEQLDALLSPTSLTAALLPRHLLSDTPRLAYSRKHAAEALGMSLRHFQHHVQPHLRCVYSGQLRLYPRSELERWIAENSCEGGRAA